MGCRIEALPSTYLVFPLQVNYRSNVIWNPKIERMERHLSSWKGNQLSKGEKITLMKSVLSNMLIYFLSLFQPQPQFLQRQRRFKGIFFGPQGKVMMRTSEFLIGCTSDGGGSSFVRYRSSSPRACGAHKQAHVGPTKST